MNRKYQPVDPKADFVAIENKWLKAWDKNGLYKKYLGKNKSSKKRFSFIDGPITANNPMGVHHAWGRTNKDLWQRYKNMQGYQQRFQNGFDCQGLWVEVGVEKELGFNSKKDIEKYGIGKFTQYCINRVKYFADKQTKQSIRLGYFMDWANSYYTNSETNNLYIWKFLKRCQGKGMLYKNKSATVWCPRCETGLSRHEQADGYKDIIDTSIYVGFKLTGRNNEYILAWTTTPWTLSANVLLAINTKHKYVKAKSKESIYYLAEDAANRLGLQIIDRIDPKDLLNKEYESLYEIPAQNNIKHFIVNWDQVDPIEGTGVVHIAPGCGEEDFELGKKLGVPSLSPLLENGTFTDGYGTLTGKYAHDVVDEVILYLKQKGNLYKTEKYQHSYPHCWRCGTKCLFRLEDNWFIRISDVRENLKKLASEATWIPDYAGKRMQNWLDNMGDWMISRKRYYGLALPFYECQICKDLIVVGDKDELKKVAQNPELIDSLPSLHRPWIDDIKVRCPKCGEAVNRVKDVGDCWLDAGVVPFATLKYFEDKAYWKTWFPADWITEMVEQVRLWYYSMLVYGYVFENKIPYQVVSNISEILDEKGDRISKSKGNGIPYDEAVENIGADVMRWMYCTNDPTSNLIFSYLAADETRRRFHLMLWNIYKFYQTYTDNINPIADNQASKPTNVLDKWLNSRLNSLISLVTKNLDNFDAYGSAKEIELFVQDFSTWYIRRSRDRANDGNKEFLQTTKQVLIILSKLLAPFLPFLSEEMYTSLTSGESVHLTDWPMTNTQFIDKQLEEEMAVVKKICEVGHAKRKELGIKVRQPLAELKVQSAKLKVNGLEQLIMDELNVKAVVFSRTTSKDFSVELDTNITPELQAEGEARDIMRLIQEARKVAGCDIKETVRVGLPSWPKEWEKEIKKKTLASVLYICDEVTIVRVK